MEKKTDKSPVEQMREWLQSRLNANIKTPLLVAYDVSLQKFNELFPEVQQVPIEGKIPEDMLKWMEKCGISQYGKYYYNKGRACVAETFEELKEMWQKQVPIQHNSHNIILPIRTYYFSNGAGLTKQIAANCYENAIEVLAGLVYKFNENEWHLTGRSEPLTDEEQLPIQDIDALAEKYEKNDATLIGDMGYPRYSKDEIIKSYKTGYKQCLEDRGSDAIAAFKAAREVQQGDDYIFKYKTFEDWQDSKNKQHH